MHAHIRTLIPVSLMAALATIALAGALTASAADQVLIGWGESKLPNAEPGTITRIAAGLDFTIALRSDGTLVGWGSDRGRKATPPAGNDYTAIAIGAQHALALKADGTIVPWGYDQYGEARNPPAGTFLAIAAGNISNVAIRTDGLPGQGSLLQWGAALRLEPQFALPTGNDFIAVAAGTDHFLALRADGSIAAWGPLGLSQINAPAGTGFTAIAAGGYHCLALRSDGSIAAWGSGAFSNTYGQATAPAGTGFTAIAGGGGHSLALQADGSILAWGYSFNNVLDAPAGTNFTAIAAGTQHSVALRADGTVTEWGQTGFGLTAPYSGVTQAVASQFHGLALLDDGSLVGWGRNADGQATPPAGNDFKAVAVGERHSIALRTDGSIAVWGFDSQAVPPPTEAGFLAIGAARNHNVAIKADGSLAFWGHDPSSISTLPAGNDFTAIAVGGYHGLALKSDGSIVGWGLNDQGQATPPPGTGFTAIAAGDRHSVALKTDGSIVAWGSNFFLQTNVPTATTYTAIAAGGDLSGAVTAAGSLVTWGRGILGGTGTPPAGTGFTKISAGVTYFMALRDAAPLPPPPPAPIAVITYPSPGASFTEPAFTITATIPGNLSTLSRVKIVLTHRDGIYVVVSTIYEQVANFTSEVRRDVSGLAKGIAYKITVHTETIDGSSATSEPVFFNLLENPDDENSCAVGVIDDIGTVYLAESVSNVDPVNQRNRQLSSSVPRERATAMAVQPLDQDLLRAFRDQILSTTPAGRYYTDLYNRMSLPMIETVLAHPTQIVPIYDALVDWTPAIQALVDGQGGTMAITPAMAAQAQTILTDLRAVATGELAAMMDAETAALDPSTWSAMSIDGLLTRVESQTRPPPEITTHPAFQSVTGGSNVMFSVVTSGAGPDTYQWFRDGAAIVGATGASYQLPSTQRFHSGQYSVEVTNPFGSTTSNTAALAVSPAAPNDARLLNLSTRGLAQSQDSVLIPGFVIQGSASKKLLIRAVGPSLADLGFSSPVIPNPRMTLKRLDPTLQPAAYVDVTTNDDWQTNANAADIITVAAQLFAFGLTQPEDAALLVDLQPGQYSVIADDKTGTAGIAIVELYDADAGTPVSRLINISNRGFVGVGDEVMIPGFVISAEGPQTVLVRVIGPQLSSFNVPGAMADPKLTIYAGSISLFENDNWSDHPDAAYTAQIGTQLSAFALDAGSKDAALVVTLQPGAYTVVGSSADGTGTGVVLVEVYMVP